MDLRSGMLLRYDRSVEAIFDLSWRLYPSVAMMLAGAAVAARGMRVEFHGHRMAVREPGKVLTIYRGFRLMMIGLAIASLGAAWNWQVAWLAILAIVIGGEETLESSLCVYGLTRGPELRLRP
jgi:hypothetical protein